MTRTLAFFAAVTLAAGCGGDFCKKSQKFAEECGAAYDAGDQGECEAALENCSKADENLMNNYLDCIDGTGVCADATDADAAMAAFGCLGELAGVSAECMGSGTTTSTPSGS